MFWKKKKLTEDDVTTIEWRTYKDKTYEELEQEVDAAYKVESRIKFVRNVIILAVLLFLFHDIIGYFASFALPRPASATLADKDAYIMIKEPEITQLPPEKREYISYNTLVENENVKLLKVANCSISAREIAKNFLFISSYFPWNKEKKIMERVALGDLGVAWGDLSQPIMLRDYTFILGKDVKNRAIYPRLKPGVKYPPIAWTQMGDSMSHIQVIPANPNIMHALIYSRKNQPIKLDGDLVSVYFNGKCIAANNFNKLYVGYDIRKGGDKKIMFVKKIQIGNKVYE